VQEAQQNANWKQAVTTQENTKVVDDYLDIFALQNQDLRLSTENFNWNFFQSIFVQQLTIIFRESDLNLSKNEEVHKKTNIPPHDGQPVDRLVLRSLPNMPVTLPTHAHMEYNWMEDKTLRHWCSDIPIVKK
jgi:hypothetical protein